MARPITEHLGVDFVPNTACLIHRVNADVAGVPV